jgi:hypothetical protein
MDCRRYWEDVFQEGRPSSAKTDHELTFGLDHQMWAGRARKNGFGVMALYSRGLNWFLICNG